MPFEPTDSDLQSRDTKANHAKSGGRNVWAEVASEVYTPRQQLTQAQANSPKQSERSRAQEPGYVTTEPPVLDAIDPSQLSANAQFGGAVGNWVRYFGQAAWHSIEGLSQPGAANDLIFGSCARAKRYYAENNLQSVFKDISLLSQDAMHAITSAPRVFEKMTPEQKLKASAEVTFNAFFFIGAKAPIAEEAAEQLGLHAMTEGQLEKLGIKRFDLPKLTLERDGYSLQAKIPGDDMAFFRATLPRPGVVDVTSINSGSLPKGMGSELLAEALRRHDIMPTKSLVFAGITNPETLAAYRAGIGPADSLLGRLGAKALKSLGIKPKAFKFEFTEDKLNLIIDVE
jgi:hypothetical protein